MLSALHYCNLLLKPSLIIVYGVETNSNKKEIDNFDPITIS